MLHFNKRPEKTCIQACGTLVYKGKTTTNPSQVTCKRCLKTLVTGSAITGKLA